MPRLKSAARSERKEPATRLVEDPYDPGSMIRVEVRGLDPLHRMLVRKEIDEAQARAGVMLRNAHETVSSAGVRAVDLSKERVDGGRLPSGTRDAAMMAVRRLHQAEAVLGWQMYRLLICSIVEGCPPSILAECSAAKATRHILAFQVRNGLEQLAAVWGLASDAKRVRQRASIVSRLTERATWGHEVSEVLIAYA